jgi:hypothetical protein
LAFGSCRRPFPKVDCSGCKWWVYEPRRCSASLLLFHHSMPPPVQKVRNASRSPPYLAAELRTEPVIADAVHIVADKAVVSTALAFRVYGHWSNLPLSKKTSSRSLRFHQRRSRCRCITFLHLLECPVALIHPQAKMELLVRGTAEIKSDWSYHVAGGKAVRHATVLEVTKL